MKKSRTKYGYLIVVFIVAIIILLIFNLIFLNRERFEKKEITKLYFADNISQAHLEIINDFNEKYKGRIEIVPINLSFTKFTTNERKELIARSLRSRNSRIDIFAVDQIWVPRFAKWAEPLAKYFMQTDLVKIIPAALSTCYYNDVLLGIPLYIDIGVLYYREDLIRQTANSDEILEKLNRGITWEEFIEYGEQHFKNKPYYLYQGDNYEGLVCNYLEILGNMGSRIYENNNLQVNTPEGRRSIQFLLDLITKYRLVPPDVSAFIERESYLYALENDALFFRYWSSGLKERSIEERSPEKVKKLQVAHLPHFSGNTPTSVFGGWNLMISKYSDKKPEAFEFLQFFLSEEVQKTLFETSGFLPILKSIYNDPEIIRQYPQIVRLYEIMATGFHRPALENYTKISDILAFYLNKVLKEEMTAEEALLRADETIISDQLFLK
jgi:multiple sugar transport system substrate-binding protein